jgi:hypothetical protein
MHLTCCLFGGQQIVTHDIIRNIMYALIWVSTLYGEGSDTSLCHEFHYKLIFTWFERIKFLLLMWWLLIQRKRWWFWVSVLDQQVQLQNLTPLLRSISIEGFMRNIILFWWSWKCMTHLGWCGSFHQRTCLFFPW